MERSKLHLFDALNEHVIHSFIRIFVILFIKMSSFFIYLHYDQFNVIRNPKIQGNRFTWLRLTTQSMWVVGPTHLACLLKVFNYIFCLIFWNSLCVSAKLHLILPHHFQQLHDDQNSDNRPQVKTTIL